MKRYELAVESATTTPIKYVIGAAGGNTAFDKKNNNHV
ncbi:hypothetical protein SFMTTN_0895 [Sulfuriferula multivorans]|uniref:Uncharacterized protein n=1 Tax=Sulfuriferula multivorans TaxID=1559896 RepID=A0A401JBQ6_9PROT|nr:hypothetical protein SFMTTN_0895 [Sulfuriferula multivorans]